VRKLIKQANIVCYQQRNQKCITAPEPVWGKLCACEHPL